ncbi:hypothetical protein DFN06_000649 [Clostridium beijerinckii]|nr:hypothetical protein [Clostridium beijerinckii]NRZ24933.1 hypothetical protein [Clostridium beijerinckii]
MTIVSDDIRIKIINETEFHNTERWRVLKKFNNTCKDGNIYMERRE